MTNSDRKSPYHDMGPRHYGLLLIPDFALLSYACTVEPLRAANRLSGHTLYRWSHIATEGQASPASNGVSISADAGLHSGENYDCILVCAGGNPAVYDNASTFAWLRQQARRGCRHRRCFRRGLSARTGPDLLEGHRLTLHWEHAAAFREDFPGHDLRRSLYEIDRDRMTCGGGTAPLDMMHALIARDHGPDLALRVSEWFLQTQIREGANPQRMALRQRLGVSHEAVLEVVETMERNLETPLIRQKLAEQTGLVPASA